MIAFLERLSARLPKRTIYRNHTVGDAPELYLERFYLWRGKSVGVYLHRFWASDEEGLHDHPWHSVTRILCGGYYERTVEGQRFITKLAGWRLMPMQMFHRIQLPKRFAGKTWTIFIRFKRQREWGFLPKESDIAWRRVPYSGQEHLLDEQEAA